jgi:hypothetical protein
MSEIFMAGNVLGSYLEASHKSFSESKDVSELLIDLESIGKVKPFDVGEFLDKYPQLKAILQDYYTLLNRLDADVNYLDNRKPIGKSMVANIIKHFYPLSINNITPHDWIDHCVGESSALLTNFADDYPSWRVFNRVPKPILQIAIRLYQNGIKLPKHLQASFERYLSSSEFSTIKVDEFLLHQSIEKIQFMLFLRSINVAKFYQTFANVKSKNLELSYGLESSLHKILDTINKPKESNRQINADMTILERFGFLNFDEVNIAVLDLEMNLKKAENFTNTIVSKLRNHRQEILKYMESTMPRS